jgi:hypothetical protein
VYRALAYAVHPSWTAGETFTVAQEISGDPSQVWYVTALDGSGLSVTMRAPEAEPDARISMTRHTFDLLLRGEVVPSGSRPAVRGDARAIARLKEWTDRAQGVERA